jgi:thiol-disulfide isomerase/thioredoxin
MKLIYVFLFVLPVLVSSCAGTIQNVISIQEAGCQSCGAAVLRHVNKLEGVEKAAFDFRTAEISVHHKGAISNEQLLAACKKAHVKCVPGAGKGSYLPTTEFPNGMDVVWLTRTGEKVDVPGNVVAGKITVIDFYAEWCGPCRMVDELMIDYMEENPNDVIYRKVNIIDWDSPVAKQHLKGVSGLPYVLVFGKDKKRIAVLAQFKMQKLHDVLEVARKAP